MATRIKFPYTERQRAMVEHPARILWVGCATKTGKSAASYCWLADGLLKGDSGAFVGPWFFRSKRAFDECRKLLEPWIRSKHVKFNEARLQITSTNGGFVDFLSADNPNALYGANYHRLVLDEASRMREEIHAASLTVISATSGYLRLFFNLELGQRNWAIRNLLRVNKLSADERWSSGEDFLTFPTDPLLVDPVLVETLKRQLLPQVWEALYQAKIPESDCSLFRNLDRIFQGKEVLEPEEGVRYVMGVDFARKKDFTVATIVDEYGNVVAMDRFTEISWSLQAERVALLARTFRCSKVIADETGIGDPVIELLVREGLEVERFMFTVPSRRLLIEELVVSCDNAEIRIPASEKFHVYRQELESFEYQLDGLGVRYAVPASMNDDTVMSLALAVRAWHQSRGAVLGMVLLLERYAKEIVEGVRDRWGELVHPKPQPVYVLKPRELRVATVEDRKEAEFQKWQGSIRGNQAGRPCPAPGCGSTSTTYIAGRKLYCNQCHGTDGTPPVEEATDGTCCGMRLQPAGGGWICNQCGKQYSDKSAPKNGATFRDLERQRGTSIHHHVPDARRFG